MKYKIQIIAILVVVLYCSCKTEQPEYETESLTMNTYPATKMMNTSAITIDSFKDHNVKAYLESYEMYIKTYEQFVKSRDMRLLDSIHSRGEELTTHLTDVTEELSEDDIQKLNAFMNSKVIQMQELSHALEE